MKKFKTLAILLLGTALALPVFVSAAEFKGTIVGSTCAHQAKLCPLEGLEEHLAMEPDFVLVGPDGTFHYLHNLPPSTKHRHALNAVTVNGHIDEKSNAIVVNELSKEGKTVWSWAEQTKEGRPYFGLGIK